VAITVDDVFLSFVENGLPALRARNVPVTVFPPTGFLGRPSSWNDYGGENRVGETVLSAEQLKIISQYENVEIGSHTVTHCDLSLLPTDAAKDELSQSKRVLEELTGKRVIAFSAPYGRFGPRERKLASECGYAFFFTSTPESFQGALKEGTFGRVDVQPEDSWMEFKLKVLGAYRWISVASIWKAKLKALLPKRKPLRQFAHV
jgi:peptidoglycan/xylan/chitin deacetylase (PgdA/CDA1 family)